MARQGRAASFSLQDLGDTQTNSCFLFHSGVLGPKAQSKCKCWSQPEVCWSPAPYICFSAGHRMLPPSFLPVSVSSLFKLVSLCVSYFIFYIPTFRGLFCFHFHLVLLSFQSPKTQPENNLGVSWLITFLDAEEEGLLSTKSWPNLDLPTLSSHEFCTLTGETRLTLCF